MDVLSSEFIYGIGDVFNVMSYIGFLEYMSTELFDKNRKIHYFQDNASYHKSSEVWQWFKENRNWIEVYNLPPYCPELNAAEHLWKYTRKEATQNKLFENEEEIQETLTDVFEKIQKNPKSISGYMAHFL